MIGIRLHGMKELQNAIKRKEKALVSGVDLEMAASVAEINRNQKALAPVDFGFLRSSLQSYKLAPLDYVITSEGAGSSYAPYQEFGTGGLVSIPNGLQGEASKWKGKGKRQVNMRAQPFFYPPFFAERPKLIQRIKDILKA